MRGARVAAVGALGAVGLGALALLGPPLDLAALFGLAAVVVGPMVASRLSSVPWPLLTIAVLGGLVAWVGLGGEPVAAVGLALVWLLAQRQVGRTGPRDDRLSAVVATLMLVLAAVRSTSPWLFVALVGWAVLLPVALALVSIEAVGARRAGPDRLPAGLAALPVAVVAIAAVVFVVAPRPGVADLGADPRGSGVDLRIGFSDEVALGDVGRLLSGDGLVFTARLGGVDGDVSAATYFRGKVLDSFDGTAWRSTATEAAVAVGADADAGITLQVQQEPMRDADDRRPPPLFTMGRVLTVDSDLGRPVVDSDGNWTLDGARGGRISYTVRAAPVAPGRAVPAIDPERWTTLPVLDPRVEALAMSLAGGVDDPWAKAMAVREHLLGEYSYTWEPQEGSAEAPLETFLFERKTGHCEYFATALAVLLRTQGVPARLVTGFAGGERRGGWWEVREANAHAWVEVWQSDRGWTPVDATPGPVVTSSQAEGWLANVGSTLAGLWYLRVLEYDRDVQQHVLERASGRVQAWVTGRMPSDGVPWVGVAILVAGLAMLALAATSGVRRLARHLAGEASRGRMGKIERIFRRARGRAVRRGWPVPIALPPLAAGKWLAQQAGTDGVPLEELAWLHYRVKYGGEDEADHLGRAREIGRVMRRLRRP